MAIFPVSFSFLKRWSVKPKKNKNRFPPDMKTGYKTETQQAAQHITNDNTEQKLIEIQSNNLTNALQTMAPPNSQPR